MLQPPHRYYAELREQEYIGEEGEDDLFIACAKGTITDIENIFKDESKVKETNMHGYSPLHVAILSDRPDIDGVVDVILRHGVDVNGVTSLEWDTALHLVAHRGDYRHALRVTIKLLEHEADPEIRNKKLRTPFDCAISRDFRPLAAILDGSLSLDKATVLAETAGREYWGHKLIRSVLESDESAISLCLQQGANTDMKNEHDAGAIHYSITHCNLSSFKILKLIVEAGCDVNLRDQEEDTALNLAIKTDRLREHEEMYRIVEYLMGKGAETTIKDLDGKHAETLAKDRSYDDIVALLQRRARPTSPPTPVPEPEPEPILEPEPEPIREPTPEVEEPPVEPESSNHIDDTDTEEPSNHIDDTDEEEPEIEEPESEPEPKEEEEEEEEEEILWELPHRTQVNKPGQSGVFPLHRAIYIKTRHLRRERIEALITLGANVHITDKQKNTALHLAAEANYPETVAQLLQYGANQDMSNLEHKTALHIAEDSNYEEVKQVLVEHRQLMANNSSNKKGSSCAIQ